MGAASSGFTKRFQALTYDHPWHMYPYIVGIMICRHFGR